MSYPPAMHDGPKQSQEALADLGRAIESGPTDPDPFDKRGLVLMGLEKFEDALADFDRCAELGDRSADIIGARAVTLLRLGRSAEALASMNEIIERQPMVRINYSRRGILLFRLGRVDEALESFDKAVELEPAASQPYLERAEASLSRPGSCEKIRADLAKVRTTALDPGEPWWSPMSFLHSAYLQGLCPDAYDSSLALDLARKAVRYDSRDPDARLALGLALHLSGHDEQARDALLKAIELRAAGYYTANRGRWDERATSFPPDHFALAMVFGKLGRKQDAVAQFHQAVARMNATYPKYPPYVLLEEEASRLLGVR